MWSSCAATYREGSERNRGAGGFVLPEAAVNFEDHNEGVIYNDVWNLSPKVLNQFRISAARSAAPVRSVTNAPAITVLDAFTGGGAQVDQKTTENHTQFNEFLSWQAGKHQWKAGINVPDISRRGLTDYSNFGGAFTFSTLDDYLRRRPFSLLQQGGVGRTVFLEMVLGAFVQDEYRVSRNLSISAGLRYDWQNFAHDNNNFSPRLSFAWAIGGSRKTVVRGGGGFFYDRTGTQPLFDLKRFNGLRVRRVSADRRGPGRAPRRRRLRGGRNQRGPVCFRLVHPLHGAVQPRDRETGLEVVDDFGIALGHARRRPVPVARSERAASASLPGAAEPGVQRVAADRIVRTSAERRARADVSRQSDPALHGNGAIHARQDLDGRGRETMPRVRASVGINSFPANNYDLSGEWARADYDQRHRLNLLGALRLASFLNLGVGFAASSGMPYTMTTGRDDNRDGLANDRPAGVPRNSLQGPAFAELDLRWSYDWRFQKAKKDGAKMTLALDAFNVTNRVNYVTYTGNLSSPFFGQAVAAKPPRRLQLSTRFTF